MISLRPPPDVDLTWRPVQLSDAEAISALIDACFDVDRGYRITAAEVLTELQIPDGDPAHDTLAGVTPERDIAALGWVIVPAGATTTLRIFDWNFVHPDYRGRGVGSFVMEWWERRGRQRAQASPLPASYRQYPYEWQVDRIELLIGNGYQPERYFTELSRDLAGPISEPVLPDGIRVEPWTAAMSEPARLVSNAAFADHWGSEPVAPARWEAWQDEFFDDAASAVAFAGPEPVGLITCAAYPHDFADRGRTEGWIERLGTLRTYRGRGLGTALINRAMLEFREQGLEYTVLGVDTANPTGAMSIYERLGFVAEKRSIAFVKPVEV